MIQAAQDTTSTLANWSDQSYHYTPAGNRLPGFNGARGITFRLRLRGQRGGHWADLPKPAELKGGARGTRGRARRVADKCNMGSEGRLLPPCLWPPRWDLLPPDSRGLILGDLGYPTCSDRSGCIRAGAHQGSPGQYTHCLRHPSLEKVTHLGRRPLGGARVAAGRRRRRWLGLRLLLSSCPARPWGRTWPGGGHPPARGRLSSHATPPALNRGVQGPRSPPCTASGGSHQPPSSSVPLGSLRAGLVTSWSAHSKVSRTDPPPAPPPTR